MIKEEWPIIWRGIARIFCAFSYRPTRFTNFLDIMTQNMENSVVLKIFTPLICSEDLLFLGNSCISELKAAMEKASEEVTPI
jgi:hypothetical protein